LWENHSIYIAPSIVSAIIMFGSFVGSFICRVGGKNALLLDPARRRAAIELPYDIVAVMLIFTAFIIGVFYCLTRCTANGASEASSFGNTAGPRISPLCSRNDHSAGSSASGQFCDHCRYAIHDAADQHCGIAPSGLAATTWANFNLAFNSRSSCFTA